MFNLLNYLSNILVYNLNLFSIWECLLNKYISLQSFDTFEFKKIVMAAFVNVKGAFNMHATLCKAVKAKGIEQIIAARITAILTIELTMALTISGEIVKFMLGGGYSQVKLLFSCYGHYLYITF